MASKLSHSVIRILDANLNRTCEGLRTLEDLARFVLNDQALCSNYKDIRHRIAMELEKLCGVSRLLARDVVGDVGTEVTTPSESKRSDLQSIASAASSRVEQSLRCLEECSKLESSFVAERIEKIRYHAYQLNAQLVLRIARDAVFLQKANLYVLADCSCERWRFVEKIIAISTAGADLIQIRDKQADAAKLIDYANAAFEAIDPETTRLVMNDRCDVATCSPVQGVHLGQTDIPVTVARRLIPATSWIGVSTHDPNQFRSALEIDVDYVGCGPTFTSRTKSFDSFAGLEYLRYVAEHRGNLPAFAIGGINLENLAAVLDTGIQQVAVASAIWDSAEPAEQVFRFKEQLSKAASPKASTF